MRPFETIKAEVDTAISRNDVDTLMKCADELHDYATPEAKSYGHRARGIALRLMGSFNKALEEFHGALTLSKQLGDEVGIAQICSFIGTVHGIKGDYPAALDFFHQAMAIREELGDIAGVATSCSNIGIVHNSTGDYPAALEFFHRALSLYEGLGDKVGMARVIGAIGNAHSNSGNYTDAMEHYNHALKMHEDMGNAFGVAQVTGNIGALHAEAGDYPAALADYTRAMALYEEAGDEEGVAQLMGNIGHVLLEDHQVAEVRKLFERFDRIEISEPRIRIHRHILHARLLETEGKLDDSYSTYRKALDEAEQYGLRAEASDLHKAMRDLAEKRNDFRAYILHNNTFTQMSDEIKGKEATLKMVMQQKQRELETIERERDRERAVLYSALPKHVADRMIRGERVTDHYEVASVMFMDIVGFTKLSDKISAENVVQLLEAIFNEIDRISARHSVTKVKTIGDAYLAVAGVPDALPDHADRLARVALETIDALEHLKINPDPRFAAEEWVERIGQIRVRIGLHCGPLVAGIVGTERLQYDIWGDTVNTSSRMESNGEPSRVHVSASFKAALTEKSMYPSAGSMGIRAVEREDVIEVKGKGRMKTYWLEWVKDLEAQPV